MSLVFKIAWGVVFGYLILFVILFFLAFLGYALFGDSIRNAISKQMDI